MVFGLNDFDETMPGPWEWDLKRLVASFVVAARDVRLDDEQAVTVAAAVVRTYRERMWEFTEMSPLEIWYDRIDLDKAIEEASDKVARKRRQRLQEQARKRVAENLFPKLVTTADGRMRIADQPPLIFHSPDVTPELARQFLDAYRSSLPDDRRVLFDRYRFEDAAVKIVGVGSVGTRCFVVLFTSEDGHPLLLQVKEANNSVMAPYLDRSSAEDPQRQTGRRRPASHAAGQRHLPRLGERPNRSRVLRPPTPRHEGVDHARGRRRGLSRTTPGTAASHSPAPTPTPAPPLRSPGTSAPAPRPTTRSRSSAWPTPTRPNRDHLALLEAIDSGRVPAIMETM